MLQRIRTYAWKGKFNISLNDDYSESRYFSFYCSHCAKEFDKLSKCRQHEKRIHIKPLKYFCDICGKIYYHKYNINVHMRSHTGHRKYSCKSPLENHWKLSHSSGPCKCLQCDKSFLNPTALKAHKNNVHNDNFEWLKCPHCPMKFKLKIALVTHLRIHTGEVRLVRNQCLIIPKII